MEDKNIIYFYKDWFYLTEDLDIMQKGYVWDWLVNYINDLHPAFPSDVSSKAVCVVLKGILKRDLAKWLATSKRRSEAGKKGMAVRWDKEEITENNNDNKNNNVINDITKIANDNKNNKHNYKDIDIDMDKDIDKVIEKDIDISTEEKNIKKENDSIYTLEKFLEVLEQFYGRQIPPKYCDIATKLYEEFGYDDSMREIAIQNEMGFKAIETAYNSLKRNDGSSWLKQIKREL